MQQPVPFGKYILLERISVGGMAEVFKAKTFGVKGFARMVAIKRILATGEVSPVALERFRREADAITQLSHPQIVTLYDHGSDAYGPYIVMELLEGEDLRDYLYRVQSASAEEAVEFIIHQTKH